MGNAAGELGRASHGPRPRQDSAKRRAFWRNGVMLRKEGEGCFVRCTVHRALAGGAVYDASSFSVLGISQPARGPSPRGKLAPSLA